MPVPTTIDDLSTTAGSNYPQGTDVPTTGDDTMRALSAFVALLRDLLNGTTAGATLNAPVFTGAAPTGLRIPLVAYKSANTARTSTTTVADDAHLSIALTAGTYAFQAWLQFWGTTTSTQGIKLQLAYSGTLGSPSSFSYDGGVFGSQVGSQRTNLTSTYTIGDVNISADGTNADVLFYTGVITVTTSGNFSLQWAQESSSANATTLGAGSWMTCVKVS